MYDVKIDISENVRYVDKPSVLCVATDCGTYKKNICLLPDVKRRIDKYAGKNDEVHSAMIYLLIKSDLSIYSSIKICADCSRNKIKNNLRKLFKSDVSWSALDVDKKIRVSPVGKCFVDTYAKESRRNRDYDSKIDLFKINSVLSLFDKKIVRKKKKPKRKKRRNNKWN